MLLDFTLEADLSEDPAEKVVMPGEGVPDQHLCSRAGIQEALIGCLEEALVGIEARFEELVEKLAKDATAVNACLIQTVSVQQMDSDSFFQVRL